MHNNCDNSIIDVLMTDWKKPCEYWWITPALIFSDFINYPQLHLPHFSSIDISSIQKKKKNIYIYNIHCDVLSGSDLKFNTRHRKQAAYLNHDNKRKNAVANNLTNFTTGPGCVWITLATSYSITLSEGQIDKEILQKVRWKVKKCWENTTNDLWNKHMSVLFVRKLASDAKAIND